MGLNAPLVRLFKQKIVKFWYFPEAQTLHSQMQGAQVQSLVKELDLCAATKTQGG